MKTRYSDFLFWMIKKYIGIAKAKGHYESDLSRLFSLDLDFIYIKLKPDIDLEEIKNFDDIDVAKNNNKLILNFKPNGGLLNTIYASIDSNWFDIEMVYFNIYKRILSNNNWELFDKIKKIKNLNKELGFIIKELREYLYNEKATLEQNDKQLFISQFNDKIKFKKEILFDKYVDRYDLDFKAGIQYFLNFNYTKSLDNIFENILDKPIFNQIHGSIDDEIIFGYGDEMDKFYREIEDINDNELLRYIKSFSYFKKSNYRHLLSFLNSGEFQVCIYGHSCGLSDRVMLNEIFEHKNCHSIRIYYYNDENEYVEKTMNISRHFTSNKLMRQKIINFNPDNKIPQVL